MKQKIAKIVYISLHLIMICVVLAIWVAVAFISPMFFMWAVGVLGFIGLFIWSVNNMGDILDKGQYDEQVSRIFDAIHNVIDKPRQEAEQEADKCKGAGDMYGWNFHKGCANGMTEVDFSVREALRPVVAAALREAGKREAELQAKIEVGLQLIGSFFEALKPLNLQAINVQNPGQHVTDLIKERDNLRREVERLNREMTDNRCEDCGAKLYLGQVDRCKHCGKLDCECCDADVDSDIGDK